MRVCFKHNFWAFKWLVGSLGNTAWKDGKKKLCVLQTATAPLILISIFDLWPLNLVWLSPEVLLLCYVSFCMKLGMGLPKYKIKCHEYQLDLTPLAQTDTFSYKCIYIHYQMSGPSTKWKDRDELKMDLHRKGHKVTIDDASPPTDNNNYSPHPPHSPPTWTPCS